MISGLSLLLIEVFDGFGRRFATGLIAVGRHGAAGLSSGQRQRAGPAKRIGRIDVLAAFCSLVTCHAERRSKLWAEERLP